MKRHLIAFLVIVATVPLAIIVTFFLTPLWRWIEAGSGIESIGHSGPANWCFVAVWVVMFLIAGAVWLTTGKRPKG